MSLNLLQLQSMARGQPGIHLAVVAMRSLQPHFEAPWNLVAKFNRTVPVGEA